MNILKILLMTLFFSSLICGCNNGQNNVRQSNLTAGMAKRTITKGQTTQAEVMEVFGPPDLVTHKDDMQVWTYDKIRYDIQSSGSYFTVLLYGTENSRLKSSSTSTMLIIYFDNQDIVRDYRLNVTRF